MLLEFRHPLLNHLSAVQLLLEKYTEDLKGLYVYVPINIFESIQGVICSSHEQMIDYIQRLIDMKCQPSQMSMYEDNNTFIKRKFSIFTRIEGKLKNIRHDYNKKKNDPIKKRFRALRMLNMKRKRSKSNGIKKTKDKVTIKRNWRAKKDNREKIRISERKLSELITLIKKAHVLCKNQIAYITSMTPNEREKHIELKREADEKK